MNTTQVNGNKLFVGGLSWGTTEESLRNLFSQAGSVVSAVVITDKYTGKSKGFGFVEMSSEEEKERAKDQFNNTEFEGRTITVSDARPQKPRDNRFGGNNNANMDMGNMQNEPMSDDQGGDY